jgi:hypothetical protein
MHDWRQLLQSWETKAEPSGHVGVTTSLAGTGLEEYSSPVKGMKKFNG